MTRILSKRLEFLLLVAFVAVIALCAPEFIARLLKRDWHDVTIEGLRAGVTRQQLEARFGPPTRVENGEMSCTGDAQLMDENREHVLGPAQGKSREHYSKHLGLPKKGKTEISVWQKEEIVVKFFQDRNGTHLFGNRIMLDGRVVARGMEGLSGPARTKEEKASRQNQVQTLLGRGQARIKSGLQSGILYGDAMEEYRGYDLLVNFVSPSGDDKVILNFELKW